MNKTFIILLFIHLASLFNTGSAHAASEEIDISIGDQGLFITRYKATGDHLIIWVAPGFGTQERAFGVSEKLAELGIETWHVDLADSLFLPKNTSTMRELGGRYLAELIDVAYKQTGKSITLLTRSYGALPVLRGAREWQQRHASDATNYFSGVILFSPETYHTVPALGLDPVYSDIVYATNIPIMLFQAGKRSNRWQLPGLLEHLQAGGAQVFTRIQDGVTGVFYSGDSTPETLEALAAAPRNIARSVRLLAHIPVPRRAATLPRFEEKEGHGLDTSLKPYIGRSAPLPINLIDTQGNRITRNNYKDRVTVINFWATWCPPCVEEIPSLNNLRMAMQGQRFELISVNYAESGDLVRQFMNEVKVDFPVLLDETGEISAKWNVLVYPATFVIGPGGEFRYGVNGAIHWDSPEVVRKMKALLDGQ